jgi:hypothetical protein
MGLMFHVLDAYSWFALYIYVFFNLRFFAGGAACDVWRVGSLTFGR